LKFSKEKNLKERELASKKIMLKKYNQRVNNLDRMDNKKRKEKQS
jgi:hypothetical protein